MVDISKQKVNFKCSNCKGAMQVTLKSIAAEEIVICSCGHEIQLRDSEGSSKKAITNINAGFKNLSNTFKKIGK